MKHRKGIQDMCKILNDNTDTAAGKLTWNKTFNFSEIDWKNIYSWSFKITSNTSLQWFQTCINHNILPTNKFLHKIKIIDNLLCSFCSKEFEIIRHLLWECEYTQKLCYDFKTWRSENNIFLKTANKYLSCLAYTVKTQM